jgi:hypothetical protein
MKNQRSLAREYVSRSSTGLTDEFMLLDMLGLMDYMDNDDL